MRNTMTWLGALAALGLTAAPAGLATTEARADVHHHDHGHGVTCGAKSYRCTICQHIYDPATGDPERQVAPGTPFEDLSDSWTCPECGATKHDFEPIPD